MKMNKLAALFIIAIIVSPNLTIVRGQTLTLAAFGLAFEPGEDVPITGTSAAGSNLTLMVVFNLTTIYEVNFTAAGDGNYTEEYMIPGNASDGVYTVTVSDGGESVTADFDVADTSMMELAESLIEQADDAEDNVEDAFDDLEDEDIEIPPEANSSYLQGVEYLDSAKENFDEGNYTGASDDAFEAIQLFGDAFEGVQDLAPAEPDDDDEDEDDETGNPERLATAIERAYAYWARLNETVTRLGGEGLNVDRVVESLAEVKGHLDNASAYQEAGNHSAAVKEFREARTTLGRTNGFIESNLKERKEKQTEHFLEQFQRRVEKITGVLEDLQDSLEAGKTQRVQAVLRSTAQRLLRLSDRLGSEDLEDILDDMEDAVDELEDGIDELNGEGLSKQLKSANRFDAQIESISKTIQRLADAGLETSDFEEKLGDAQDLLARIEETVREGDKEAAEDLIDEFEEVIDELKDDIEEATDDSGKSRGRSRNQGRGRSQGRGRGRSGDEEDDETDDDDTTDDDGKKDDDDRLDDDDVDDDDIDDDNDDDEIDDDKTDDAKDNETEPSDAASEDISEELKELAETINRIEKKLRELNTTSDDTTAVENLIDEAKDLMDEAEGLEEEDPDGAEELLEAAEEILDEASGIIKDLPDTEDTEDVDAEKSDDDDDDDSDDEAGDDDDDEPESTT